jgi:hypothetical protein
LVDETGLVADDLRPVGARSSLHVSDNVGDLLISELSAGSAARDGDEMGQPHLPQEERLVGAAVTNKRLSKADPPYRPLVHAQCNRRLARVLGIPYGDPGIRAAGDEEAAVGAEGEGKDPARVPGELLGLGRACVAEIEDLQRSIRPPNATQRWSRLKLDPITVARRDRARSAPPLQHLRVIADSRGGPRRDPITAP